MHTVRICVPPPEKPPEKHVSKGICVPQVGQVEEHTALGICVSQVGENISLAIRVSPPGKHVSLVIY